MFGRKKIKELETSLKWATERQETMLGKIYALEGDLGRIVKFLDASFENVNERRLVKKGGPEKGG